MADQATLQQWLSEAETARHALATGAREQTISSSSGKSLTFFATDLTKLDSYIASLRRQLGQRGRPFRFRFGG